jgi:hypothetical protein
MWLVRWERVERRLGGGIAKQLREVGASVREVNFGSLQVAVDVKPGFRYGA